MTYGIVINRAITLNGLGTLKKIAAAGLNINTQFNKPVITINSGVKDVLIKGITVDGNRSGIGAVISSYNIGGFFNQKFNGVRGVSTSPSLIERVTIKDVFFKDTYNEAIYFDAGNDYVISGCRILNCQQASFLDGTQSRTLAGLVIKAGLQDTDYENQNFKNVTVKDCYFDQTAVFNGCVKIQATSGNIWTNVTVENNSLLIADYAIVPGPDVSDDVGIIGVEVHCTRVGTETNYGTIQEISVIGNYIKGIPLTSTAEAHDLAISVAGSCNINTGIRNALIANNRIVDCHDFSIEAVGRNMTLSDNVITRSGRISINSTNVGGGMYDIKVIGNTMLDTFVGQNSGYHRFFACIHINATKNQINGVLIEGNSFDSLTGNFYDSDFINITSGVATTTDTLLYNVDIIGNQFLGVRRNGVFFSTYGRNENIRISDNRFTYGYNDDDQTEGFAIYSNAASASNLMISGNSFDCRKYDVNHKLTANIPYGGGIRLSSSGTYSNVRITDNNLYYSKSTIWIQTQIDRLVIVNNILGTFTTGITYPAQTGLNIIGPNLP